MSQLSFHCFHHPYKSIYVLTIAPGAPDQSRAKKTPAEAAAIHDEKAKAKEERAKKRSEGIHRQLSLKTQCSKTIEMRIAMQTIHFVAEQ
jgi:hypothetical protein